MPKIFQKNALICITALIALIFLSHPSYATGLLKLFPKGEKPGGFVFGISVIVALFTVLAVHELGHLLTGLLQGFRFQLFVVGFLGIRQTEKGIRIYFNKNPGYMGGVAATVPARPAADNKLKFARLILAGPLASLVFAVVCFLLFPLSHGAWRGFWLTAGAGSLGIFLATTIPKKSGIFFTDRARYQRLTGKGKAAKIEEAMLAIMAQYTLDGSCKNISLDDARLMKTDDEAFMRFWGYYYEYQFYTGNNMPQAEAARKQLIAVKHSIPPAIWKSLEIEGAVTGDANN